MHGLVAAARAVALAIGDVFQDRRDRFLLRILRQPQARRQAATVFQGDPEVFDLLDLIRQAGRIARKTHLATLRRRRSTSSSQSGRISGTEDNSNSVYWW